MWLDRFSVNSTPSGSPPPLNRNRSPAPRRQSHLAPQKAGTGLGAGGSSLSLGLSSNTSNVSLPINSRTLNSSTLRHEHRPAPEVPNPLDVLGSILGTPAVPDQANEKEQKTLTSERHQGADENTVTGAAGSGDDTEEKATPNTFKPRRKRRNSTKQDRRKYEDFHSAITECDEVLKSVESYLTSFQADLGVVSAEIEHLQSRSIQLDAKLDNRRKVEKLLGPAVEDISISPQTVRTISEGPVDEKWIRALADIEARSAAIAAKASATESVKAIEDVKPLLDDLNSKAVERIRDYIVAQIKALRSPNINAQILQHQTFIKYKELYAFLFRNHKVLGEEISQAYINTMKWYYSSNFTRYQQALEKLNLHIVDQHDVLGAEASVAPRRNLLSTARNAAPPHDPFSLSRRADVLKPGSSSAISSYLAEEDKTYHYIETIFRNFNVALIDNVCAEYSIVTELFSTKTFQQVSRKVVEIFEPAFALGHALTKQLIEHNTDGLGILLCLRLNQHFAFEMQRRKVPVGDSYINGTNMLLWPRFQMVMDLHCESLKKVSVVSNRGASAAFSLVGGTDTSKASAAPHAVTQRFGQLLHGILTLSSEAGDDQPVSSSLGRLTGEFETLMIKLSKGAGGDAAKRARFLFNNYSLVLTIISDTHGKLAQDEKNHFEGLLKEAREKR